MKRLQEYVNVEDRCTNGWFVRFYPSGDPELLFDDVIKRGEQYLYADWEHVCGHGISVANHGSVSVPPEYCSWCSS